MNRKLLSILLLILLTVGSLWACTPKEEEKDDEPGESGSIFAEGTDVYIMVDSSINVKLITAVRDAVKVTTGKFPTVIYTDDKNADNYAPVGSFEHEIVICKSNDYLVLKAYSKMREYLSYAEDSAKDGQKVGGYSVYSDGSSIVLAYTDDVYDVAMKDGVEFLVDEYIKGDVTLKDGLSDTVAFSLYDRLEQIDDAYYETAWAKLEEFLEADVIKALKELTALYTDGVYVWLANLYDPEICVCGTDVCQGSAMCGGGGFYYANSGRDNIGFYPDIDSTYQAMVLLSHMGMARFDYGYGKSGTPDWMKQQIVQFVKMRQDPNGFFYHPQWTKEQVDAKLTRRGRDLDRAVAILSGYGVKPTYDTPIGTKGDGLLWDGTPVGASGVSYLTSPLIQSSVSAVSKIIATSSTAVADHLKTKEALASYLEGLEAKVKENEANAYSVNNELANQNSQVLERERQLKEQNADWSPCEMIIDYLNRTQNKETGTWSSKRNYNAVDAMFKAAHVYTAFNQPYPNAKKAALFAVETITSTQATTHICNIYNCWCSIDMLMSNIRKFGEAADAQEVQDALMSVAPAAVRATLTKYLEFRKADGSFSYYKDRCSAESQGMQLAIQCNEGDMNATSLCHSVWGTIFNCFGLKEYEIPLHGGADYARYLDIIEENSGVIKNDPAPREPLTFDDDTLGDAPLDVSTKIGSNGGSLKVISDPRDNSEGNVIQLTSNAGYGDTVVFPCNIIGLGSCFVFEGDFCVAESKNGYIAQINLGASCYMLNLNLVDATDDDGTSYKKVKISECSSQGSPRIERDLGISARLGEWFNIRIEYYLGTHDSVRIKVYFNGELAVVTDNYYDHKGVKITTGVGSPNKYYTYTQVNVMSDQTATVLMDNILTDKTDVKYTPCHDLDNQPLINIDPPNRDEVIYTFDELEVGKDYYSDFTVTENNGTIANVLTNDGKGKLLNLKMSGLKGETSFYVPAVTRTAKTNCGVVEGTFAVNSAKTGAVVSIRLRANDLISGDTGVLTAFNLEVIEVDGKQYVTLADAPNGKSVEYIDSVQIELKESFTLRLEHYEDAHVTLIYVNGTLVASSDKLTSGGSSRVYQRLEILAASKNIIDMTIDNLKSERIVKSYTEATKPEKSEIVYDFDSGLKDAVTNGSVIGTAAGKVLWLKGNDTSITLPLNYRATVYNFYRFSTLVEFSSGMESSYTVRFLAEDGKSILAYKLVTVGGKLFIYEETENGVSKNALVSIDTYATSELRIEYYPAKAVTQIYYDGKCIAISSTAYSEENARLSVKEITVSADKNGDIVLDNCIADSYNNLYVKKTVSVPNEEDDAKELTFEHSSTGSIPAFITTKFASLGADLRVKEMIDRYGKVTKSLYFSSTAGTGDYLNFALTDPVAEGESFNALVFEADMTFRAENLDKVTYQFFFEGASDSNNTRQYLAAITHSGGKLIYKDYSNGSSSTATRVDGQDAKILRNDGSGVTLNKPTVATDWFNLRIEIYSGTRNEMKILVYIDDVMVYATNNFYLSHVRENPNDLSKVTRVSILALSGCEATMVMDNVSIKQTNKEMPEIPSGTPSKFFTKVNDPIILIPEVPEDTDIPPVIDYENDRIYSNTKVTNEKGENPTLTIDESSGNKRLLFASGDGGDYIKISPTVKSKLYSFASFETDMTLRFNTQSTTGKNNFCTVSLNAEDKKTAFRFQLEYNNANGNLVVIPRNSMGASSVYPTVLDVGTDNTPTTETRVVNMRIEYYMFGYGVVIILYFDGTPVYAVDSRNDQSYTSATGVPVEFNYYYTYSTKGDTVPDPLDTIGGFEINTHSGKNVEITFDNLSFVQGDAPADAETRLKALEAPKNTLVSGSAGDGVYLYHGKGGITGRDYKVNKTIWADLIFENASATNPYICKDGGRGINADGKAKADAEGRAYLQSAYQGSEIALELGQLTSATSSPILSVKSTSGKGNLYVFETALVISSCETVKAGEMMLDIKLKSSTSTLSNFFGSLKVVAAGDGSYCLASSMDNVYDATINAMTWHTITLEYYHEEGIARYYLDGEYVASEKIVSVKDIGTYEFAAITLTGAAEDSFIRLDNTVVMACDKEFVSIDGEVDSLATVLPVKDGANGVLVLIHDDGDLDTMEILDRVYGKYSLKADVAMVVNRLYNTVTDADGKVSYVMKDSTVAAWKEYVTKGWGVINHSFTHNFWGTATKEEFIVDEDKLNLEIVESLKLLNEALGTDVKTFAYPGFDSIVNTLGYGKNETYEAARKLIEKYYVAGREYNFTQSNQTSVDLFDLNYNFLPASSISHGLANLNKDLARIDGAAAGGLTVLFSHMVVADKTGNTNNSTVGEDYIEAIAKKASAYVEEGRLWNAHLDEAMLYLREAQSARVHSESKDGVITVTLTDNLPDEIYNYALTVEIIVPDEWTGAKVTQGDSVSYERAFHRDGKWVIFADIVPDAADAVITVATEAELTDMTAPTLPCSHVDAEGDGECDECGEVYYDSYTCKHFDGTCTECNNKFEGDSFECIHRDFTDSNKICNNCGSYFVCEHIDSADASGYGDGRCDSCSAKYFDPATCKPYDANSDGKCDKCGVTLNCNHTDSSDSNGVCDVCSARFTCAHKDSLNSDGKCDKCGALTKCTHKDKENSDGICDKCEAKINCTHTDTDGNGVCEKCEATFVCEHTDNADATGYGDGICDKCGCVYHNPETCKHFDGIDSDKVCNKCGASFTCVGHVDKINESTGKGDGKCDECGCIHYDPATCPHRDSDGDGYCNNCGTAYSDPITCKHEDEDEDGECDKCGYKTSGSSSLGEPGVDYDAWN